MKKFFLIFLLLSFLASNSYASYYVMGTNTVLNEGDLMEKVQAALGLPTRISIREETISTPVEVTDWVYMTRPVDPTKTQYYLPYLTVNFNSKGQVTGIKRSQLNSPNDAREIGCMAGVINVGDDDGAVLQACGNPTLINRRKSSEEFPLRIVEWVYEKGALLAPVIFRFENGILKQMG